MTGAVGSTVHRLHARAAVSPRVVLVADDYPAVLAWATYAFQRSGWQVLTATDGPTALALAAAARVAGAPVGVLVTDLDLPGLDGSTLARHLRAVDARLPVLAMHAGEGADAAWRGPLPVGALLFEQPVRAGDLVATAAALLAARLSADPDPPCVAPGPGGPAGQFVGN